MSDTDTHSEPGQCQAGSGKQRRSLWLILLVALLSIVALPFTDSAHADNLTSKLDAMLEQTYNPDEPGVSVIVRSKGKVLLEKGYGLANLEHNIKINKDTVFRLGSITKQFTAVAILMLAEQGKLSLDDTLKQYIPEMSKLAGGITIAQLLNHSSGLTNYTNLPGWDEEQEEHLSSGQMIDLFKDKPLDFEPGSAWNYSNTGYFLLGVIIEKASGETYADYVENHIFQALGMRESFYGGASKIINNRASGYDATDDGWVNAPYLSMTQPYAAGSLLSSVGDLAIWIDAINNHRLISKTFTDRAHTKAILTDGSEVEYGFGWRLATLRGSQTIEHNGGINGFSTSSVYLPKEDLYVAVLSNRTSAPRPGTTARLLLAEMLGKPYIQFEQVSATGDELTRIVGVYDVEDAPPRTISIEDGQLYSQRQGGRKSKILPGKDGIFFYEHSLTYFTIEYDEDGNNTGMLMRHDGDTEEFAAFTDEPLPE
jgi:CubicO group peptidase (beta-lactamase class C family)